MAPFIDTRGIITVAISIAIKLEKIVFYAADDRNNSARARALDSAATPNPFSRPDGFIYLSAG